MTHTSEHNPNRHNKHQPLKKAISKLQTTECPKLNPTLNDVHPTIKFTMELEKDGMLPFLDTKLTRREGWALDIAIYRKQTHMDRYLHFNSHHPAGERGQLSGVSSTGPGMSHYGRRICRRKRSTSPLLSNKMVTPYLSFVPSPPPHRNICNTTRGGARRARTPGGRGEATTGSHPIRK